MDFLTRLFDPSGFPARWYCGTWTPALGWLHIVSDLGVWSAYIAIPCVLGYFILRKKDLPFRKIFLLFGAFIAACGTTHLIEAILFWWPVYRLAGLIKLLTAVVSWATVFALAKVVPQALAMRSPEELEREIDARKQAEQAGLQLASRLQLLLESSGEGIYGVDLQNRCTFINRAGADLLGGAPESFLGREMHEAVHHHRADGSPFPVHECRIVNAFRSGGQCRVSDEVFWRLDGASLPVEYTAQPLLDGDRRQGAVVTFTDITARARAAEDLRLARDAAEAASAAKGAFLANMSHEIRTPMNGILGMTDLVLETTLSAEQQDYLGVVKTSAESLLTVIDDVLDFSKIEAGKFDLTPVPFNLRESLTDMLRALSLRAKKKGLELRSYVEPGVPDLLVGDIGRVRQVMVNLVGNALKFTSAGEVVVRVAVENYAVEHVLLRFSVSDTGVGIPNGRLAAVFDPFVQADGSTTRRFGGTGLGLTISKRLVELLGGRIWVESRVGRGSDFVFTAVLGVRPPEAAKSGVRSSGIVQSEAAGPTPVQQPPLHVLLAEDNPVNQRLAARLLEKQGHTVEVAASGVEALDALDRGRFDLVLMDVQMPEMDGLEATRELRRREKGTGARVPVIALTAHALKGDRDVCLAAGMDGYVAKPIKSEDLRRAIADQTVSRSSIVAPVAAATRNGGAASIFELDGGVSFDRAALLRRLGGDVELFLEIVALFGPDCARLLDEMHEAVASNDFPRILRAAHTLGGSLESLCARPAGDAVKCVASAGRAGDAPAAAAAFEVLAAELGRLNAAFATETKAHREGAGDAR